MAVSGAGVVSPLGCDVATVWAQARAGRSAVRRLDAPFAARLASPIAATVSLDDDDSDADPVKARMRDRFARMGVLAARQAVAASQGALHGLAPGRGGVFVGTGMGGTLSMDDGYRRFYGDASDRIPPFTVLLGMHHAAAAWIGMEHGLQGPHLTYANACASGAVAIGEAWARVSAGDLEVAVAGGAEAPLSAGSMKAWEALHTVATVRDDDPSASCRPFSRDRSGLVLGEGAAMFVLEPWERATARGADVLGEVLGCGQTSDAGHITRPDAAGQAAAMRAALASAGLDADAVDAINAHGTGTQANDRTEAEALRMVFGRRAGRIPVSATKGAHGHLLGAAGALEALLALLAMRHATALPTLHLHDPDPACDLDLVPHAAREGVQARVMLSNSFAFGGSNAVLALGRGA